MYISEIYISSFGKIRDKKFILNKDITLFYGKNEAGKTTIYKFINYIFYGLNKLKGRASKKSSYYKYKPVYKESFGGYLKVIKDDKIYKIERDFLKTQKNSLKILNETDSLIIEDKEKFLSYLLNDFSYDLYKNTLSISQLNSKIEEDLYIELKNYITNINTTFNQNIDIIKAINNLKSQKKEILKDYNGKYDFNLYELEENIKNLEEKYSNRNDFKLINLENDINKTKKILESKKDKIKKINNVKKYIINISSGFFIFFILIYLFINNNFFSKNFISVFFVLNNIFLFFNIIKIIKKNRLKNKIKKEISILQDEIISKIDLLTEIKKEEFEKEIIKEKIDKLEEKKEIIKEKIKKDNEIKEEVEAIDLAIENINFISNNIKQSFSKFLNKEISENFKLISNEDKLFINLNDEMDILLYKNEDILPLFKLSCGAIDQIYFSFRLAISNFLQENNKDKLPMILDDSFINYDKNRLKRSLDLLKNKYKAQKIIFTHQEDYIEKLNEITEDFSIIKI